MNKKISLGAAIAFMAIIAAATFAVTMVFSQNSFNDMVHNVRDREAMFSKLAEVNNFVRQEYYYEVDNDGLMDGTIRGYLEGLGDPYARYLTAAEYSRLNQSYEGASVGIGIVTELDPAGYLVVTEVYPDSSAMSSGVAVGDVIVRIDDVDITASNMAEMQSAIEGEAGTKVQLTIRRDNTDTVLPITRRYVETPTVYSQMFGEIGYIQITEFNDNTPDQFNRYLDRVRADGAKALIFDLRDNPGGTITSVSKVLDRLLPEGTIVSATFKDGTTEVLSTSDENEVDLPMVVLVNNNTASAAELFAQAIKDYEKGMTVGVTTRGKGSMQKIQKLSDGSAIDITVALYNPPKSPNFNGVGIRPDFEVKLADGVDINDRNPEYDAQLKKALEYATTASGGSAGDALNTSGGETSSQPEEGDSSSSPSESSSSSEPSDDEDDGSSDDGDDSSSDDEDDTPSEEESSSSEEESE